MEVARAEEAVPLIKTLHEEENYLRNLKAFEADDRPVIFYADSVMESHLDNAGSHDVHVKITKEMIEAIRKELVEKQEKLIADIKAQIEEI